MELPPLDHAGWGRLLAEVLADRSPGQRERATDVATDEVAARAQARARLARTTVQAGSSDVLA